MDADKLIDELVRDEGLRLKPYLDNATPPRTTIGIGRNLSDVGISREEAYHLAHNDIERVTADLDQHLPWWRSLNEARQRVLCNMAFNMGVAPHAPRGKRGLADFEKTLALIKAAEFEKAGNEMLDSAWAKQVGARAFRLSQAMIAGLM